jgi:hypothetical protein
MEDIYNDSATAQAEADHLRKSRDVPLFENLHKFYAHVHEDVMQKFPKDTLILMAAHPAAQTKQQIVEEATRVREAYVYFKMPDLWLVIYSRFDLKTLGRIAQVSHFFYYVSENDRIWRPLFESKFGNSVNFSPKISRGNNTDAKRPKEMQMTVLSKSSGSDPLNNSNESVHAPAEQHSIFGSIFQHSQHNVKKGPSWKERYRRELLQILKEGPIWIKEKEKGALVSGWFLMWAVWRQRKLRIYKVKNDSVPFAIVDFHADTVAATTMSLLSRHYGFYIRQNGYNYELGTDDDADRQEWVKLFNEEIKQKQAERKG